MNSFLAAIMVTWKKTRTKFNNMEIIDVGHKYKLLSLDGKLNQTLQFVKRFDPKDQSRFPGNHEAYPGTTLQDVIQCLLNRVRYLNNQIPCVENEIILNNLRNCLLMLEQRAAKRHRLNLLVKDLDQLEFSKLCKVCGHTLCIHCQECGSLMKNGTCQNYGCEPV